METFHSGRTNKESLTNNHKQQIETRLFEAKSDKTRIEQLLSESARNFKDESRLREFLKETIDDVCTQQKNGSFRQSLVKGMLLSPLGIFGNTAYGFVLLITLFTLVLNPVMMAPLYLVVVIIIFYLSQTKSKDDVKKAVQSLETLNGAKLIFFTQYTPGDTFPFYGLAGPYQEPEILIPRFWQINDQNDVVGKTFFLLQDKNGNDVFLWGIRTNLQVGQTAFWSNQNDFIKNFGGFFECAIRKHEEFLMKLAPIFQDFVSLSSKVQECKALITSLESEIQSFDEKMKVWDDLALPDDIKEYILKRVYLFRTGDTATPKGLLLFGPPGTGKTLLAKAISASADSFFLSLSLSDLKAGYIGHSGQLVKKIWESARSHKRSIIFVDECEGVFGRRGSIESDSFNAEIVQSFLAEWDGVSSSGQIWVIGATNRKELIDDAMVSRFGAEIEIPLPGEKERSDILIKEFIKLGVVPDIPSKLIQMTSGMSGRDLATLARNVKTDSHPDIPNDKHFLKALESIKKRGGIAVDEAATWDALILSEEVKNKLVQSCEMLKYAGIFKKQGISAPRGILLYGPPGTGKTQIARTFANESKLHFIAASTADLKAGYIGQSCQKVRELFERARSNSPAIIFIDEIEVIAASRTGANDIFTQEIVAQLLQELDGVKNHASNVFVLAATNHLEQIDSAVLSRLPIKIEVCLPDADSRAQIFETLIEKIPATFDKQIVCRELANSTDGKSGRDIRSLVENATQNAVFRAISTGKTDQVLLELNDFNLIMSVVS